MNIDIILPYKEIFSKKKASAVSLTVKNSMEYSEFKSKINIYGQFTNTPFIRENFIGIKVNRIFNFGKNRSILKNYLNLTKSNKNKKTIIEIHNRPYLFNTAVSQINNCPISLHYHNDPTTMSGSKTISQRIHIAKKAAAVYFVSNFIKNQFLQGINKEFKNLFVLPNGIQRRLKNQPEKKKEVLFIGRLVYEKGSHLFVEAINDIVKKNPEWNFKIIGTARAGQSALITDYEKKVIKDFKSLGKNTTYLGFISNFEVQDILKTASILVIPSLWDDPFPLTAIEGLSTGTAIIASNRGGLTEMLIGRGILINDINKENLENSITNFILNKDLLNEYQNKSWNNYIFNQSNISQYQDKIRRQIFRTYFT